MRVLITSLPLLVLVAIATVEAAPPGGRKLLWWGNVWSKVESTWNRVEDKVENAWDKAVNKAQAKTEAAGEKIQKGWDRVTEFWDRTEDVRDDIRDGWEDFADAAEEAWSNRDDVMYDVNDWLINRYKEAKRAFQTITDDVDFDEAVERLVPLIHSDMTVRACTYVCRSAAGAIIAEIADLAEFQADAMAPSVCTPMCDAALAFLEEEAMELVG